MWQPNVSASWDGFTLCHLCRGSSVRSPASLTAHLPPSRTDAGGHESRSLPERCQEIYIISWFKEEAAKPKRKRNRSLDAK